MKHEEEPTQKEKKLYNENMQKVKAMLSPLPPGLDSSELKAG